MRKSLLLILILLATAPGCCVLELHPFPWMVDAKPPSSAPIDAASARATLVNVAESSEASPAG